LAAIYNCLSLQPDLKNTPRGKAKKRKREAEEEVQMLTKDKDRAAFLLTKSEQFFTDGRHERLRKRG
jgi:hypothetical protein